MRGDRLVPLKDGGKHKWPVADVQLKLSQVLPDKQMVKRAGVDLDGIITPEQTLELAKCMFDPIYFIKTYCRIMTLDYGLQPFELYEFQEDLISMYVNNRFSIACTGRQLGKCVTGDSLITLRNKDCEFTAKIGEFYEWVNFREWAKGLAVQQPL